MKQTSPQGLHPANAITVASGPPSRLIELVKRFRVCWEVWPEYLLVSGARRQVGFELLLCGAHEQGVNSLTPGCPHCCRVFEALQEIATWIEPQEFRQSKYRIGCYDAALHYAALRQHRPDVALSLKFLHREHIEAPVDECQLHCLEEMKARLRSLGAPEGRWSTQAA